MLYFSNSLSLSPATSYYWNVLLRICNNFSEQNVLDKPTFSNVSRLNHSSPLNNNVTNKTKHFPQLFALGLQIALNNSYFLFWSVITTKLDIYVYTYREDYICKRLLQAIYLFTINIWLNFMLVVNPPVTSKFVAIY